MTGALFHTSLSGLLMERSFRPRFSHSLAEAILVKKQEALACSFISKREQNALYVAAAVSS